MINFMIKKYLLLAIIISAGMVQVANAGPLQTSREQLGNALSNTGLESRFEVSVGVVVKGILSLVGTIFLVLTIYAGILWMTAQGNEDRVAKAKNIIQAAVIGLFVVMAAYAITSFITGSVTNTGTDAPSNTPPPTNPV